MTEAVEDGCIKPRLDERNLMILSSSIYFIKEKGAVAFEIVLFIKKNV